MKILVGAPTQNREWIIGDWMQHAIKSVHNAGADPEFLLVCPPNDPGAEIAADMASDMRVPLHLVLTEEDPRDDVRVWNGDRYGHMVYLRNLLLESVRRLNPDYFLSLDTDILLHSKALYYMLPHMRVFDAVGGKTFMTSRGDMFPSFAFLHESGALKRFASSDTFQCDVIMAIKLMSSPAFHVDYQWAKQGEDIGWSKAAREAGLKLGWCGTVASKHVMVPERLGEYDERCGY